MHNIRLFSPYLFNSAVRFEVTAVGGQWWEVEAFKPNRMKLKQKPGKFIWQHRENGIDTQRASVPLLDFSIVQCIKTAMLASTTHQCVHDVTSHLNNTTVSNTKTIKHVIIVIIDIICKSNLIMKRIPTLARSHILTSITIQGPSSSAETISSNELFQKRSGANSLPAKSVQGSPLSSPSSNRHRMASHNS